MACANLGRLWNRPTAERNGWRRPYTSSAFLLPAAFAEELLARGYVFSVLRDASDWRWSLGATSIGFGLLHLQNNGATPVSLAMVMLAGVFLGLVRMVTGQPIRCLDGALRLELDDGCALPQRGERIPV